MCRLNPSSICQDVHASDRNVPLVTDPPHTTHGIAGQVIRFANFLKSHGFRIFPSGIRDSLISLQAIDISSRSDVLLVLRANLCATDVEWAQFETLFEEFWGRAHAHPEERDGSPRAGEERARETGVQEPQEMRSPADASAAGEGSPEEHYLEGVCYSPVSAVTRKDLAELDGSDLQLAQLVLKQMMAPFRIDVSRRSKRSRRAGDMDFRRTMRRSIKSEGIPVEIFHRQKKRRLKRLVILADVSGSMDRYARFVMPFLMGLRGVGSRAEVFVFSTSLASITFYIRHLSIDRALERIIQEFPDWSGGTRIGFSLHQFNEEQGQRLLNRRTVVVIVSDGWDLGAKELLRREMAYLSRRAASVIWLNPLAKQPDYAPLCQGMMIALPYVDHFLPADSLESLRRVGRLLSNLMIHG